MPGAYLVNCGQINPLVYGPIVSATDYECLMIHRATNKAVVVARQDIRGEAGVTTLVFAPTWAALVREARSTDPADVPTGAQRTAVTNWCNANGYTPPTVAQVTWAQLILFVARQVNPGAQFRDFKD